VVSTNIYINQNETQEQLAACRLTLLWSSHSRRFVPQLEVLACQKHSRPSHYQVTTKFILIHYLKNDVFWDVTPCGSCKKRLSASIMRVTRISELGPTLAVTSKRRTLPRNTNCCHPDDGGAKFLRNVGSYKSHTA
jgi:hypothetical protein